MQPDVIQQMREEIDRLRERIRVLEAALAPALDIPIEYGLTATEGRLFAHLSARPQVTKRGLYLAAYGDWTDETPDEAVIESHVCRLRRKLLPFGFRIIGERFAGYRLIQPGDRGGRHAA